MLDGKEVQMNILDTAGQENYAGLYERFSNHWFIFDFSYSWYLHPWWRRFSSSLRCYWCRILFRFEWTLVTHFSKKKKIDRKSFFVHFSEQILRVKNGNTNIPAILVGNKIDLADKRRVTPEDAEQKARTWSMRYIETSAKTKHNVDKAFCELMRIVRPLKDTVTTDVNGDRATSNEDSGTRKCCVIL